MRQAPNVSTVFVKVEQLHLDILNPRFSEGDVQNQEEAIVALCRDEQVLELAKDIGKLNSITPLAMIGAINDASYAQNSGEHGYVVVDGNRRLCALKLLTNPSLAPAESQDLFEKISKDWAPIEEVPIVLFSDRKTAEIWLIRTHEGERKGIGRKDWNAEQIQRHSGSKKNALGLAILDYAQRNGMITRKQRSRKITTTQRYLSGESLREALGITGIEEGRVLTDRTAESFHSGLGKFIADLIQGDKVTSRVGNNTKAIVEYAHELAQSFPVSRERVDSAPITTPNPVASPKTPKHKTSRSVSKAPQIRHLKEIADPLPPDKYLKLASLYSSLCGSKLQETTVPLFTVGVWTFIECLSAAHQRPPGTSFYAHYTRRKIQTLLDCNKHEANGISQALLSLERSGNMTKHHRASANFDRFQLVSDMQCLEPLIIAICKLLNDSQT